MEEKVEGWKRRRRGRERKRPGGAGEKEVVVRGPVVGIEMRLPHRD